MFSCPKACLCVCLSQPLGIMRLISGSLRQPERSLTPVSFSSLLPIGRGDINRRCHRILAAAHACHYCQCRHLGRLCKIHRVRTVTFSVVGQSPRAPPWGHISLQEGFLLLSSAMWPGAASCSSFWSLRSFIKCLACSQLLLPPSWPSPPRALHRELAWLLAVASPSGTPEAHPYASPTP